MYYVIQVAPGKERDTELMIEKLIRNDLFTRCFFLTRDMRKKFRGKWKLVHEKLLPGYVFMECEDILAIYEEARHVPMLTKFLGRDDDFFVALGTAETQWIDKLTSCGPHVPVAKVYIPLDGLQKGDKVILLESPLKDLEGYIKKFDIHHGYVAVEVEFMGKMTIFHLGIEAVQRADEA